MESSDVNRGGHTCEPFLMVCLFILNDSAILEKTREDKPEKVGSSLTVNPKVPTHYPMGVGLGNDHWKVVLNTNEIYLSCLSHHNQLKQ